MEVLDQIRDNMRVLGIPYDFGGCLDGHVSREILGFFPSIKRASGPK